MIAALADEPASPLASEVDEVVGVPVAADGDLAVPDVVRVDRAESDVHSGQRDLRPDEDEVPVPVDGLAHYRSPAASEHSGQIGQPGCGETCGPQPRCPHTVCTTSRPGRQQSGHVLVAT